MPTSKARNPKAKKPKKPEPWKESQAKRTLKQMILRGETKNKSAREVYEMRVEFRAYEFKKFSPNFRNLCDVLKRDQDKADSDAAALAHDRLIHPKGPETAKGCGYPRWDGSDAERLLTQDIDNGLHETHKPQALYKTRPEYQHFPLKVFRDHIHQVLRARLERPYWLNRKKKGRR